MRICSKKTVYILIVTYNIHKDQHTSCSTCRIEIWEGIRSCPQDIIRNKVLLPRPFLPTKPYLLPKAKVKSAPCSNTLQKRFHLLS